MGFSGAGKDRGEGDTVRKLAKIILVLALLAAIGWALWLLFPSEERRIRKQLENLAAMASFTGQEGNLKRLTTASELAGQFTRDAVIMVGIPREGSWTIRGSAEVQEIVLAAMARNIVVNVEFHDIIVKVEPDKQSAVADLTARVSAGDEPDFGVQELRFLLRKGDSGWRIERLETLQTFRRAP